MSPVFRLPEAPPSLLAIAIPKFFSTPTGAAGNHWPQRSKPLLELV
jgi:hypothetical protein